MRRLDADSLRETPLARRLLSAADMTWLFWLGLAVAIGILAAVTGIKPKGTRPVAGTRMMGVGRVVLLVIAAVLMLLAYRGCSAA